MAPLTPQLRLVFWETTAGCNLRCVHCRRIDVMETVSKEDLTPAEGLDLVDQVAGLGRPILVLSGGEPLMRPDIFDLADRAKSRGLRVALATNGTLIDAPQARRIRQAGFDRVAISLDGATPATHDAFRGIPGSHVKAVSALRALHALGVGTQVNFTVARHNVAEVPAIYDLAIELGADALHFFMLVPVGCGVAIADREMLPAAEYERWLAWLWDREQEGKIELKATCAPHYFRVMRQGGRRPAASHHRQGPTEAAGRPSLHQTTRGCLAGVGVCFVSHRGQVFPCGYLPVPAGDLRRQPLKEIWDGSGVFGKLRDPGLLKGKCGGCEFKTVCGGCRARAFGMAGDWLGEEPFCTWIPGSRKSLTEAKAGHE
ncbi:MAG: radical SAM protein [Candidatus Coatesbacteria bacterium]